VTSRMFNGRTISAPRVDPPQASCARRRERSQHPRRSDRRQRGRLTTAEGS
jgi:hypothetical protein